MKWFNVKTLLSILFIGSIILWVGLSRYFERYSPVAPNVEIGKIYPYNVGGKTVYLDSGENVLLYVLPSCIFLSFFILARIHLKESKPKF